MSTVTTTLRISGMTCSHCVASVTEELETLGGVNNVVVGLNNGGISTATITSEKDLSSSQISAAVAEAGYLVVASEA